MIVTSSSSENVMPCSHQWYHQQKMTVSPVDYPSDHPRTTKAMDHDKTTLHPFVGVAWSTEKKIWLMVKTTPSRRLGMFFTVQFSQGQCRSAIGFQQFCCRFPHSNYEEQYWASRWLCLKMGTAPWGEWQSTTRVGGQYCVQTNLNIKII